MIRKAAEKSLAFSLSSNDVISIQPKKNVLPQTVELLRISGRECITYSLIVKIRKKTLLF